VRGRLNTIALLNVALHTHNCVRQAAAEEVRLSTGATLVHPSNDVDVISGQGTLALEALEQVAELLKLSRDEPPFDAFIVPLGGTICSSARRDCHDQPSYKCV
jgi:threonine dehydratase